MGWSEPPATRRAGAFDILGRDRAGSRLLQGRRALFVPRHRGGLSGAGYRLHRARSCGRAGWSRRSLWFMPRWCRFGLQASSGPGASVAVPPWSSTHLASLLVIGLISVGGHSRRSWAA